MNQNALAQASGSVNGPGSMSNQSAHVPQHLGMHATTPQQQQMMAQMLHQAQQNGGLGLPAQGLAAALQQQQNANHTNGVANSPTQMYRAISAQQAQAVAAHQSRMGSGSPALAPARPDSRGGSNTPVPSSLMARSMSNMSGGAGHSPILGQTAQGMTAMNGAR